MNKKEEKKMKRIQIQVMVGLMIMVLLLLIAFTITYAKKEIQQEEFMNVIDYCANEINLTQEQLYNHFMRMKMEEMLIEWD